MAYRRELEKYLGRTIQITGRIGSRSAGNRYGFLFTDITLPNGERIDHVWLPGLYDLDLAAVNGSLIRCEVDVQEYWKDGRIDGRYVEGIELGIGFSAVYDNIEVLQDGQWVPSKTAATASRKKRNSEIKRQKTEGTYVWPGTWTYHTGTLKVKAAKAAVSGSLCDVKSRGNLNDKIVVLDSQIVPGVWSFHYQGDTPTT